MIILKWATHTDAPKKGVADMRSMAKRFANWLGHDDMARVRFENARDYRDARLAEIEAVMEEDEDFDPSGPRKTLSNHLKVLKALFNYAADNYPDDFPSGNPFARVKFDPGQSEKRATFTSEERARILTLARDSKDPIIKWCNLLAAYGGQRNEELADAHTRDIECIDGTWVMRLRMKHRTNDQRVKTKVSVRTMPVHSAVLAEGFIDMYVRRLPDRPLFPQVALDGYGRRSGKIT